MLTYLPQGSVALQGIKTRIPHRIKEKGKKVYIYVEQSLMPAYRYPYSICDVRKLLEEKATPLKPPLIKFDKVWLPHTHNLS